MPRAVLVGSSNADVGMEAAAAILRAGGRALDAVEAAVRLVEDNPSDHTVGYGGYPNRDGVVELDASIMDGTSLRAGAVGALRGYRQAISVARAVMEQLPHVLVVGEGAAGLAAEIGLTPENLLTAEAERAWRHHTGGAMDPEHVAGTVNVLARDRDGNLASAVSTSGWAWKHPGRLGDSPVIGAGNYADSRAGAVGCTGWGELAIRAGTARMLVAALAAGRPLADAGAEALRAVLALENGGQPAVMHLVALTAAGEHGGFSTSSADYLFWEDGMAEAAAAPRVVVA